MLVPEAKRHKTIGVKEVEAVIAKIAAFRQKPCRRTTKPCWPIWNVT